MPAEGGVAVVRAQEHGHGSARRFSFLPSGFVFHRGGRRDKACSKIAHREVSQEQQAHAEEVYRKQESPRKGQSLSFRKAVSSGSLQEHLNEEQPDRAVHSRKPGFWHKLKFGYGTRTAYQSEFEAKAEGRAGAAEQPQEAGCSEAGGEGSIGREEGAGSVKKVEGGEMEAPTGHLPGEDECGAAAVDYEAILEKLRHGSLEEQSVAASDVRTLARADAQAREIFGSGGAIAPLVGLLNSPELSHQNAAVLALLNLAIGNNSNKQVIVDGEGALARLVDLLEGPEELQANIVAALLSLSALDANKSLIGGSGAIPTFIKLLKSGSLQRKKDALGAVYNMSLSKANLSLVVGCGAVAALIALARDVELRDKALAVLSHLVGVDSGRRAIGSSKEGMRLLIEALSWEDCPKAQERAVFILMVIGHHSHSLRTTMARGGAVNALLELVLLGSPLAQKRASKLLDSFREDREKGRSISAPMATGPGSLADQPEAEIQEEVEERRPNDRRAVDRIVQQSLQRNFLTIVKRANKPATSC